MSIQQGIQLDPGSSYPISGWTPLEYVCACGKTVRADAEMMFSPSAQEGYQHHCGQDSWHVTPGRVFVAWEKRGDDWIVIGRWA